MKILFTVIEIKDNEDPQKFEYEQIEESSNLLIKDHLIEKHQFLIIFFKSEENFFMIICCLLQKQVAMIDFGRKSHDFKFQQNFEIAIDVINDLYKFDISKLELNLKCETFKQKFNCQNELLYIEYIERFIQTNGDIQKAVVVEGFSNIKERILFLFLKFKHDAHRFLQYCQQYTNQIIIEQQQRLQQEKDLGLVKYDPLLPDLQKYNKNNKVINNQLKEKYQKTQPVDLKATIYAENFGLSITYYEIQMLLDKNLMEDNFQYFMMNYLLYLNHKYNLKRFCVILGRIMNENETDLNLIKFNINYPNYIQKENNNFCVPDVQKFSYLFLLFKYKFKWIGNILDNEKKQIYICDFYHNEQKLSLSTITSHLVEFYRKELNIDIKNLPVFSLIDKENKNFKNDCSIYNFFFFLKLLQREDEDYEKIIVIEEDKILQKEQIMWLVYQMPQNNYKQYGQYNQKVMFRKKIKDQIQKVATKSIILQRKGYQDFNNKKNVEDDSIINNEQLKKEIINNEQLKKEEKKIQQKKDQQHSERDNSENTQNSQNYNNKEFNDFFSEILIQDQNLPQNDYLLKKKQQIAHNKNQKEILNKFFDQTQQHSQSQQQIQIDNQIQQQFFDQPKPKQRGLLDPDNKFINTALFSLQRNFNNSKNDYIYSTKNPNIPYLNNSYEDNLGFKKYDIPNPKYKKNMKEVQHAYLKLKEVLNQNQIVRNDSDFSHKFQQNNQSYKAQKISLEDSLDNLIQIQQQINKEGGNIKNKNILENAQLNYKNAKMASGVYQQMEQQKIYKVDKYNAIITNQEFLDFGMIGELSDQLVNYFIMKTDQRRPSFLKNFVVKTNFWSSMKSCIIKNDFQDLLKFLPNSISNLFELEMMGIPISNLPVQGYDIGIINFRKKSIVLYVLNNQQINKNFCDYTLQFLNYFRKNNFKEEGQSDQWKKISSVNQMSGDYKQNNLQFLQIISEIQSGNFNLDQPLKIMKAQMLQFIAEDQNF